MTTRVVIPLDRELHDLDPEEHVFPILRAGIPRVTVGAGFGAEAEIVATIPEGEDAQRVAQRLTEAALQAGLHPYPAKILSKQEYDDLAIATSLPQLEEDGKA